MNLQIENIASFDTAKALKNISAEKQNEPQGIDKDLKIAILEAKYDLLITFSALSGEYDSANFRREKNNDDYKHKYSANAYKKVEIACDKLHKNLKNSTYSVNDYDTLKQAYESFYTTTSKVVNDIKKYTTDDIQEADFCKSLLQKVSKYLEDIKPGKTAIFKRLDEMMKTI